jgi:hypothetical protein
MSWISGGTDWGLIRIILPFICPVGLKENHELIMKFLEVLTRVGVCHFIVFISLIVKIFMNTFHCSLKTTVVFSFSP